MKAIIEKSLRTLGVALFLFGMAFPAQGWELSYDEMAKDSQFGNRQQCSHETKDLSITLSGDEEKPEETAVKAE